MPATVAVRGNQSLLTSEGQTFLVGEEVYLRPFAPADAEFAQSWRFSPFPISPDRIRTKLDDGKVVDGIGQGRMPLLILRKHDDRPVGSVLIHTGWFPNAIVEAVVDPIHGADGDRWKGEAVAMCMTFVVEERHMPIVEVSLLADETATIAALERIGARQVMQFREMFSRNGRRVDGLMFELLNRDWLDRLGDPAEREQPRSGTGVARPVMPAVEVDEPPANAVRIGPRVYLRPICEDDARARLHMEQREDDASWSNGRGMSSVPRWWHQTEALQKEAHPDWIRFAVCLRDNDDLIGFVGLAGIDYRHRFAESESELLNLAYRGRGYGSEAKHLLFDYAFNTLGLHMLESWVLFENTRSAAALRKQGYRDAGRIHWVIHRDGSFTHVGTFQLHADAWRAMPRRSPDKDDQ